MVAVVERHEQQFFDMQPLVSLPLTAILQRERRGKANGGGGRETVALFLEISRWIYQDRYITQEDQTFKKADLITSPSMCEDKILSLSHDSKNEEHFFILWLLHPH